jgi:hypothetical protein
MLAVVNSPLLQTPLVVDVAEVDVPAFEKQLGIQPDTTAPAKEAAATVRGTGQRKAANQRARADADRDARPNTRAGKAQGRNVLVYNVADPKLLRRLINITVIKPQVKPMRLFTAQSMLGWLLDRTIDLSKAFSTLNIDPSAGKSTQQRKQDDELLRMNLEAARRNNNPGPARQDGT